MSEDPASAASSGAFSIADSGPPSIGVISAFGPQMRMTRKEFGTISSLIKELCGINLSEGKEELVKARLAKRMRKLDVPSFSEYLAYLNGPSGAAELPKLLDAISTNVTQFFREPDHFTFLRNAFLPRIIADRGRTGRNLRFWSAGCSSGEEPFSMAIHLREGLANLRGWDVRILATDLSADMLERARAAVWDEEKLEGIPSHLRVRYFERVLETKARRYRLADVIRQMVLFSPLNLMGSWPMKGPFDAIFCRNVMIYFDKPTQAKLISRYFQLLRPGGILFIGHSESLTGIQHGFRHVLPTVYQKP